MFSPDLDATSKAWGVSTLRMDINPGNETQYAFLDFDVPAGTQPSDYMLMLHASPASIGATVRLKSCAYATCS